MTRNTIRTTLLLLPILALAGCLFDEPAPEPTADTQASTENRQEPAEEEELLPPEDLAAEATPAEELEEEPAADEDDLLGLPPALTDGSPAYAGGPVLGPQSYSPAASGGAGGGVGPAPGGAATLGAIIAAAAASGASDGGQNGGQFGGDQIVPPAVASPSLP